MRGLGLFLELPSGNPRDERSPSDTARPGRVHRHLGVSPTPFLRKCARLNDSSSRTMGTPPRHALCRARAEAAEPGLAGRLEGVAEVVRGDLRAEGDAGEDGEAVVHASPDARVDDLGSEVVRAVEVLHRVQVSGRAVGIESVDVQIDLTAAEEGGEDGGHPAGHPTVCGRVLGMVRRHEKRPPARLLTVAGFPSS